MNELLDEMKGAGCLYIEIVGPDDIIKHAFSIHNAFVDAGRNAIRDQMYDTGAADQPFSNMAIGDGTSATTDAMTALESELSRAVYTFLTDSFAAGTLVASASFTGLTATISEVGIFNSSSSGTMDCRALLSPYATLSSEDTLKIRYTLSHT